MKRNEIILGFINIVILVIFLFSSALATSEICFPTTRVFKNEKTKIERYLPHDSQFGKFMHFPLAFNSFVESGQAYEARINSYCGGADIAKLQELTYDDFSILDKFLFVINVIIFIILIISPIGFFVLLNRRIKSIVGRIVLDVVFFILYMLWISIAYGIK